MPSGKLVQFSNVPSHSEPVTSNSVTFVMRQEPVEITVSLIDAPSGQFEVGALGNAAEYTGLGNFAAGAQVTITYIGTSTLEGWVVRTASNKSVQFTTSNKSCTFTMPAENVKVGATTPFEE